jgi:hypothetical protein
VKFEALKVDESRDGNSERRRGSGKLVSGAFAILAESFDGVDDESFEEGGTREEAEEGREVGDGEALEGGEAVEEGEELREVLAVGGATETKKGDSTALEGEEILADGPGATLARVHLDEDFVEQFGGK